MTGLQRRLIWATFLVGMPCAMARAQTPQEFLPLRFVRASARTRRRFEDDWNTWAEDGREWAYCVTQWSISLTQNQDTVYMIDDVQLVRKPTDNQDKSRIRGMDGVCDRNGVELPIAHAHPSGDCSPSRSDIHSAIPRQSLFEFIICGPKSTAGYFGQLYKDAVLGRALAQAPTKEP